MEDRLLKFFGYQHLPEYLQDVSMPFHILATRMCEKLQPGPERSVMLRKLLEAKDCAVRQALEDAGQ